MNQVERPTGVLVMGIIMIVFGGIALLMVLISFSSPLMAVARQLSAWITISFIFSLIATIIAIVSGIGCITGNNWARMLYAVIYPIFVVIGVIINMGAAGAGAAILGLILPAIFYTLFMIFMFNPVATAYFTQSAATPPAA